MVDLHRFADLSYKMLSGDGMSDRYVCFETFEANWNTEAFATGNMTCLKGVLETLILLTLESTLQVSAITAYQQLI